jgi:cell division protein FtsW
VSREQHAGGSTARYVLMGAVVFLVLLGLVMVYSASSGTDFLTYHDSAYHIKRQALSLVAGLIVLLIASRVDYRSWKRFIWPALLVSDAALVAVMLAGVTRNGARSWFDIGGLSFQPSELAKLVLVFAVAVLIADRTGGPNRRMPDVRLFLAALGPVLLLVLLQRDMGTAMTTALGVGAVLILGGVEWRYIAVMAGVALVGALVLTVMEPYRVARLMSFLNPWADPQGTGYHTIQSLLAFGSGGWKGAGLGMSAQKYFYLPEAQTDFIFSIIGEELGLWGTLSVVLAFGAFAVAGFRIALGARDLLGKLVAGGLTTLIVGQAAINMAAATQLMPITGLPLPFVSYGGTSLLFTMAGVGLILSVSSHGLVHARGVAARVSSTEGIERASTGERRGDGRPHLSGIDGGRTSGGRRA